MFKSKLPESALFCNLLSLWVQPNASTDLPAHSHCPFSMGAGMLLALCSEAACGSLALISTPWHKGGGPGVEMQWGLSQHIPHWSGRWHEFGQCSWWDPWGVLGRASSWTWWAWWAPPKSAYSMICDWWASAIITLWGSKPWAPSLRGASSYKIHFT